MKSKLAMGASLWVMALMHPAVAQEVVLDEVVVAGTQGFYGETHAETAATVLKTETPILETPRSVTVVTAQQMAEKGVSNVVQALSYSAGVDAGQWGLDNRSDWSSIRGFAPTTYHDGLLSRYGWYNDTKPEAFLLDSVSVLRGPASGLYGNGSVGGVVNTTSKVAGQGSPNILQTQVGSHGRKQVGIDWSGRLSETLEYRLVGVARDSATQVNHSRDDVLAFAPSITWRPTDSTKVTALLNVQNSWSSPLIQFASQYGTLEPAPNGEYLPGDLFVGEPDFDRYNATQRALTLMAEHELDSVWTLGATARVTRGTSDYRHAWWAFDNYGNFRYNEDGTINRTFYAAENDMRSLNLDANARAEWALGTVQMQTLIGASYTRGVYDSDYGYGAQIAALDPFNPVYSGAPDITITDYNANTVEEKGLYLQNRATFGDRLHLDTGLRWGSIETGESTGTFTDAVVNASDSATTGNAALLYRFDNGVAPYVSYAESFKQEFVGTDVDGNPFKPSRGAQYEVGTRWQSADGASLVSLALFDITRSNITVSDPANPGFMIQTGKATSRGVELELRHAWGDFALEANASWLRTEDVNGARLSGVPERMGSVWATWKPSEGMLAGFKTGLGVRARGAVWDGSDVQRTPGFGLVDAMIGYETEAYDLALNVRNLGNLSYVSYCGGGACYIGDERSVALTLTAKF